MRNKTPSLIILFSGLVPFIFNACTVSEKANKPVLQRKINLPEQFLTRSPDGLVYGGDIRVGDLTGNGIVDFLVYRSVDDAHDGGGMKPRFLGAFDLSGNVLWQQGGGGLQPSRPGPVTIHDIDDDGEQEVICFFLNPEIHCPPTSLRNVVLQIRNGKTGTVEKETAPAVLLESEGQGANWVHQRLLICNLQGTESPQDFIVKLGTKVLAFDQNLELLWSYTNPWDEYTKCPAYIPAVGDIDSDGRDEINGGYFLLDDDGSVMWEEQLGRNMDSVTIAPWDDGNMRAFGSGFGHILDAKGNIILRLGEELVPHGQELRVAHFDSEVPGPQMMIRYDGHNTPVLLVGTDGTVIRRFDLNDSPNHTGMEVVFWHGQDKPALLFNGGTLWNGNGTVFAELPDLPPPVGSKKQGWYHCIPVDLKGNEGEEVVVYNPWDSFVAVYGSSHIENWKPFNPNPRQYNARLMD